MSVRRTPGTALMNDKTGDTIYMRGFDASSSIYVDGVRDVGSISRDVFNIEQMDPDPFMAMLNAHGLPWTVEEMAGPVEF